MHSAIEEGGATLLPFEFHHKGLYEREGRRLYVNSGIGNWLTMRINCPPDITLIELTG